MAYKIVMSPDARDHLRGFPAAARAIIVDAMTEQLAYEPLTESRNRKPLRPNPMAPWELRVRRWRIFYDVTAEPEATVTIVAIGEKRRNELWIGGEMVLI